MKPSELAKKLVYPMTAKEISWRFGIDKDRVDELLSSISNSQSYVLRHVDGAFMAKKRLSRCKR